MPFAGKGANVVDGVKNLVVKDSKVGHASPPMHRHAIVIVLLCTWSTL